MSRLARALALGMMLAAMTVAGLTAVAQAQPTGGDDQRASQDQTTGDATTRAALAQERYYSTWGYGDPAVEQALAQERYYGTWRIGDTTAPVPAGPGGQSGWLVAAIGVLAAALALLGALAAMIVRRTRGRVRVRQAA